MITPRFNLSQDEKWLTIKIRAPYCNLRELDIDVEENVFLFLCKPYYLRLNLPGSVTDNNYKSAFDSDTGEFTFSFEKLIPGEEFKDLEFITKFLITKLDVQTDGEREITVLASEGFAEEQSTEEEEINTGFGFALQCPKTFLRVFSEFTEVFDVNPCEINLPTRHTLRLQNEQAKFDIGHYVSDYIEDGEIEEILAQNTPWFNLEENAIQFTNQELDFLKDLPNIEHKLSQEQVNYVFNGLIDILYAFCYDRRVTFYDDNSESGWTIVKLSASLCWLDVFESARETIICSVRRSLIFPLYRHFKLSVKILEDLNTLLKLGEKYIIKCLIEIYNIFLRGDCCRYILNSLFIKDYIIYIMKWDKNNWREFLKGVFDVDIKKDHLGLNLAEVEEGFVLDDNLSKLKIRDDDSDDTDTYSDTDTSTSTYSDSSDAVDSSNCSDDSDNEMSDA